MTTNSNQETDKKVQQEKFQRFHSLHTQPKILVLPNIWDPLGALLLEDLGYEAAATASASVAFANGYNDGECIPFRSLLQLLSRITDAVRIPITADVESGFAASPEGLRKNIHRLLATGIVGINVEDSSKKTGKMLTLSAQCKRIELIRNECEKQQLPLFINARTDVYLQVFPTEAARQWEEARRRGEAYREAGAHGFFPIALRAADQIHALVRDLGMPINISMLPGSPALRELEQMGVARVSLGPGFLKLAMQSLKTTAMRLKHYEGEADITDNPLTSAYLKNLVLHQTPAAP